jgi:hypothetical protein
VKSVEENDTQMGSLDSNGHADKCENTHDNYRLVANRLSVLKRKLRLALLFLVFKEPNPKHHVAENLSWSHAILTFFFCTVAVSYAFLLSASYGLVAIFAAGWGLLLLTLMALHTAFDR